MAMFGVVDAVGPETAANKTPITIKKIKATPVHSANFLILAFLASSLAFSCHSSFRNVFFSCLVSLCSSTGNYNDTSFLLMQDGRGKPILGLDLKTFVVLIFSEWLFQRLDC